MALQSRKVNFNKISPPSNSCILGRADLGPQRNPGKNKKNMQQISMGRIKGGVCAPLDCLAKGGKTKRMGRMRNKKYYCLWNLFGSKIRVENHQTRKPLDKSGKAKIH